jgi:hypothetical protein
VLYLQSYVWRGAIDEEYDARGPCLGRACRPRLARARVSGVFGVRCPGVCVLCLCEKHGDSTVGLPPPGPLSSVPCPCCWLLVAGVPPVGVRPLARVLRCKSESCMICTCRPGPWRPGPGRTAQVPQTQKPNGHNTEHNTHTTRRAAVLRALWGRASQRGSQSHNLTAKSQAQILSRGPPPPPRGGGGGKRDQEGEGGRGPSRLSRLSLLSPRHSKRMRRPEILRYFEMPGQRESKT